MYLVLYPGFKRYHSRHREAFEVSDNTSTFSSLSSLMTFLLIPLKVAKTYIPLSPSEVDRKYSQMFKKSTNCNRMPKIQGT